MDDLFSVEGKNIIVTGAARGIGLAIAKGLHERGAHIFALDRDKIPDEEPYHFFNIQKLDLNNASEIREFRRTCDGLGILIHGLINNAGISKPRLGDAYYEMSDWHETLQVNLTAILVLFQELNIFMSGDMSIINIASLGGVQGFPNNPAYCASKGGVIALTRAMAVDLPSIRVNSICPGYIKTEMTKGSYENPQHKKKRDDRMIMNRWGEPEDLIGACIFLLSKASSYITGINLPVDGGWLAKGL